MNEEMVNGLIGQLNLGLIISKASDSDLVSIPNEDVAELLICLDAMRRSSAAKLSGNRALMIFLSCA